MFQLSSLQFAQMYTIQMARTSLWPTALYATRSQHEKTHNATWVEPFNHSKWEAWWILMWLLKIMNLSLNFFESLFHFWKKSESWTTKQTAELPRKNGISKVLKSRQWIRQAMRLCTSLICWLETSCTRRNWERSHMSSHELHEIQVRSPKE